MLNYQRVDRNWWKLYVCHFWDTPLRFPCRNNQVQKLWDFHLVEIGVFRKWNGFVALDCWVPNDIQPTQKWVGCARMLFFFRRWIMVFLGFPKFVTCKMNFEPVNIIIIVQRNCMELSYHLSDTWCWWRISVVIDSPCLMLQVPPEMFAKAWIGLVSMFFATPPVSAKMECWDVGEIP